MDEYSLGALNSLFGQESSSISPQLTEHLIFSDDQQKRFERSTKAPDVPQNKRGEGNPEKRLKRKRRKLSENGSIDVSNSEAASNKIIEDREDVENCPDYEKSRRTIFVGNIPISCGLKAVTKYFSKFGEIESSRMRSVPILGTAVDDIGNQQLVKKVCSNKKDFGEQKASYNAYIVFKSMQSAEASLIENNQIYEGRHLRVDKSNPSRFDPKLTVFIGSLPSIVDEEDLRSHFSKVYMIVYYWWILVASFDWLCASFPQLLTGGQEDIIGVRIIRDTESMLCKGDKLLRCSLIGWLRMF